LACRLRLEERSGLREPCNEDHEVDLVADVEMVGADPHPPVLTTVVRPNLVVGDEYRLCSIMETTPTSGGVLHGKGTFKAHVVCVEQAVPPFAKGGAFELRSAERVFGAGRFREIVSFSGAEPNH
jgi:hypothetical protein